MSRQSNAVSIRSVCRRRPPIYGKRAHHPRLPASARKVLWDSVARALTLLWIVAMGTTNRLVAAQDATAHSVAKSQLYKATAGPFETDACDELALDDANRDEPLPIRVTYPTNSHEQPYPIIVFSHGAGGSKKSAAHVARRSV